MGAFVSLYDFFLLLKRCVAVSWHYPVVLPTHFVLFNYFGFFFFFAILKELIADGFLNDYSCQPNSLARNKSQKVKRRERSSF
jgi:hypothetical protein